MKRSTARILTTHVGSLPRPAELLETIEGKEQREVRANPVFQSQVQKAVSDVVRKQAAAGLDIINDGEMSKRSFSRYITERIKPHVGPPSEEQQKQKCPFCRLATDSTTRVVTCMCGAAYHWETADSHPNTPENDRLRCFEKIQNCLSCGRQLSKEETLVWDPATL